MDAVDGTKHVEDTNPSREQSPSLLTIILDTNPAAWALLQPILPISNALASILVFINAHLACDYTNQVAVIASHCDKAQWLYPTATVQQASGQRQGKANAAQHNEDENDDEEITSRSKRVRPNGTLKGSNGVAQSVSETESKKYRPFRLIEEELVRNLSNLLSSTSPNIIQEKTSTMVTGALTLALTYINRRSLEYREEQTGMKSSMEEQTQATITDSTRDSTNTLQSRILVITLSPSTDLAHQYIPLMNAIFACQKLSIPIDVLQLPLPADPIQPQLAAHVDNTNAKPAQSSTVFLQQASDATHGIFIAARLTPPSSISSTISPSTSLAQHSMLTYLLTSLLSTPSSRLHLITPTRVDVDFRAACFCHRNVISIGFVCSICLSIFCDQSLAILTEDGCMTCGTKLGVQGEGVGSWAGGKRPVVVAAKKKGKKKRRADGLGSAGGTPRPATPA